MSFADYMKGKRLLIFVQSPFQLISAYEFIKKNNIYNYKIISKLIGEFINDEQMINTAKILELEPTFICMKPRSFTHCIRLLSCWKIFFSCKVLVYVPEFSQYGKIISFFFRQRILIDDGLSSLFRKTNKLEYAFSLFEIENGHLQENTFSALNKIQCPITSSRPMIIGSGALVTYGKMKEEDYIQSVKKARSLLGSDVIYIPHRAESERMLKRIEEELNIQCMRIDVPIEIFMMRSGVQPSSVVGFASTALFSLMKIYPNLNISLILDGIHHDIKITMINYIEKNKLKILCIK